MRTQFFINASVPLAAMEPGGTRGRPGSPRRDCAAFSLVETIVATAIAGIVLMSLYAAFSTGFTSIRLSQETVRGDQILVEKLETLRLYDWSEITNGTFVPTNFTAYLSSTNSLRYSGTMSIVPVSVSQSYSNSLRQVTVNITWNEKGYTHNRSMTTLVSQNGLQTYTPQ